MDAETRPCPWMLENIHKYYVKGCPECDGTRVGEERSK